jgi:hypothetical protein
VKVRTGLLAVLLLGVMVGAFLLGSHAPSAFSRAEQGGPAGFAHYNVVETEGHNLIVTDNLTNTLYFYTIEKEKQIGSELHLRGSLNLTQVGKPVLTPKLVKTEK